MAADVRASFGSTRLRSKLDVHAPRGEAPAAGVEFDLVHLPGRQVHPGGRAEFDPVRQVDLDTDVRDGAVRRVGDRSGEPCLPAVVLHDQIDAAPTLAGGVGQSVLHPRCAGLDVHSRCVNACVRIATGQKATTEHREFATITAGLFELAAWLSEAGCTHVAMEATDVYWKRPTCTGSRYGTSSKVVIAEQYLLKRRFDVTSPVSAGRLAPEPAAAPSIVVPDAGSDGPAVMADCEVSLLKELETLSAQPPSPAAGVGSAERIQVVGTRRVAEPRFTLGDYAALIRQSDEPSDYLRCELPLPGDTKPRRA